MQLSHPQADYAAEILLGQSQDVKSIVDLWFDYAKTFQDWF